MPKPKYYVVWKGRQTGIFESWPECEKQTRGVEGAKFKSFPTKAEAEQAFQGDYREFIATTSGNKTKTKGNAGTVAGTPLWESLSVDAACSGNPGRMEYRGVWTKTGEEVFREGPFEQATVNIGEFLAIVHGLALLKKRKIACPIYSDSRTALKWVRDKAVKTKLEKNRVNEHLFNLIDRALTWLNENDYPNSLLKWETGAWGEIPADFGRK
jgi:ribonuclease HI